MSSHGRTPGVWILCALCAGAATPARAGVDAAGARFAATDWCARVLAGGTLRPDTDAFVATAADSAAGFWFVSVEQRWRGRAVIPVNVRVVLDRNGRVTHWSGQVARAPRPEGRADAGSGAAIAQAFRFERPWPAGPADAEPVIAMADGRARFAWRVRGPIVVGAGARALVVDANDGAVLAREGEPFPAVAYAYASDPRDPLETVTLTGLGGDETVLRGPLVNVGDPAGAEFVTTSGDFRVVPTDPDTTRFDHVSTWVFAQRYLGWLRSLGYAGFRDTLRVRVHMAIAPSVAVTQGPYVVFGDPMPGYSNDPAKASDVVAHELQHFVAEGYGIVRGSNEGSALQEGLSDYMAAAFTGDARIGDWVYIGRPDGATSVDNPPDVFRYANFDHVHFGAVSDGTPWANGMIFSGALWDLRRSLGATVDSLVLEALARVSSSPDFGDFATALVVADRQLHGGAHIPLIKQALGARGIGGHVDVAVSGPDSLYPGEPGTFTATAAGDADASLAIWSVQHFSSGVALDGPREVGRGASITYRDSIAYVLNANLPTGWGGTEAGSRRVWPRRIDVPIEGPATLVTGVPGAFGVTGTSLLGSSPPRWSWRARCRVVPCVAPESLGTGWGFVHADSADFDLVAEVPNAWGVIVTGSLTVTVTPSLLAIAGPDSLYPGEPGAFRVTSAGGLDSSGAHWYAQQLRGSAPVGVARLVGVGGSLRYGDTTSFVLRADVPNVWGRIESRTRRIAKREVPIGIRGPVSVLAGQPVTFDVPRSSFLGASPPHWSRRNRCVSSPCPVAESLATGWSVTFADTADFVLTADVPNAWGATASALLSVHVRSLVLDILGPASLAPGSPGTFTVADSVGLDPATAVWGLQRYCGLDPCGPEEVLGSGRSVVHADTADFALRISGRDGWGRALADTQFVSVATPAVSIDGPAFFVGSPLLTYAAQLRGYGPWSYAWSYDPEWPGARQDLPGDPTVRLSGRYSFDLGLSVADARGRTATARVHVRRFSVGVQAYTTAAAGERAYFRMDVDTLFAGMSPRWQLRSPCRDTGCAAPWADAETTWTMAHGSQVDYRWRARLFAAGRAVFDDSGTVRIKPPSIRIEATAATDSASGLGFHAAVSGGAPYGVAWFTRKSPDAAPSPAGSGVSVVVHEAPPYRLLAVVSDTNGRTAADSIAVDANGGTPGSPRDGTGLECVRVDAMTLRMVLWGPRDDAARLAVYDLAGREVARWFDGPFAGGARAVQRSTSALGQGVYFCRWRTGGRDATRRFVVVR